MNFKKIKLAIGNWLKINPDGSFWGIENIRFVVPFVLFSALCFEYYNWTNSTYFENPKKLRYTLGKYTEYFTKDFEFCYRGIYFVNGKQYDFGTYRTSDLRPNQVLQKYIWIEFNIDSPDYARAYTGYDVLIEDSVPISPAGITLVEYKQIE